ncbi:MAG TPA: ribosome recycling factor [Clostridiales bacterium]|jgi:ribosome recycling factor|nr:ribosome recycling factor [Clostridiales bacterium]
MKLDTTEFEEKMEKSVAAYDRELQTIRAGRANPAVLDDIRVDYYGAPSPIQNTANVVVTDARTITITPWETNMLKEITKAIQASDLGINPTNDGKNIRLAFPQPTEERRRDLTKQVNKRGEDAKVNIRNIRREANDRIKEMKKNSEMSEDEQKVSEKEVQELTDRFIKKIDEVTAAKNEEIMEI